MYQLLNNSTICTKCQTIVQQVLMSNKSTISTEAVHKTISTQAFLQAFWLLHFFICSYFLWILQIFLTCVKINF